MKKTKRKVSSLTSKSTDEEIARWTKSHDIFDRLETGISEIIEDHSDLDEVLREAIFQDRPTQYASAASHEGRAEQTCAPAHNGRDDSCSDMACGTTGARTQNGMNPRAIALWMFVKGNDP